MNEYFRDPAHDPTSFVSRQAHELAKSYPRFPEEDGLGKLVGILTPQALGVSLTLAQWNAIKVILGEAKHPFSNETRGSSIINAANYLETLALYGQLSAILQQTGKRISETTGDAVTPNRQ